ncbi:hypothetical protein TTRE_0000270201 [Trichuris trichiura]|uniref:Uncharacterized protein n=1 Tax=Trichuris trichiura TaxID=36087 RepID=A0A077Z1Q9_TRITR|nr:hypothetical protein TTRE_0000270201 [Trichuris trichiura]
MESQNNDKRQNLPQAASGEKKSAKAEKEEKTDIRAKPVLQENKEPTGAANVGVVDLSNGGSVLFEKLQQITANVTDPVQQLLMVPDEGFESMKETVTQTIRSMTPEQRRLLTVSCKQLLGYATQTPRGATRAAEIVFNAM